MRALLVSLSAVVLVATPAAGDVSGPREALDRLDRTDYARSISMLERNIRDLSRNVVELDQRTTQGTETVIALTSDILFEFDKSDISAAAERKIADLVSDIPAGAEIKVHGHTDSWGGRDYNQTLSEARAQTVADVIEEARSDLSLEVRGFGMTQPVAPNERGGEDDPEGRALNRRVEIRFQG